MFIVMRNMREINIVLIVEENVCTPIGMNIATISI